MFFISFKTALLHFTQRLCRLPFSFLSVCVFHFPTTHRYPISAFRLESFSILFGTTTIPSLLHTINRFRHSFLFPLLFLMPLPCRAFSSLPRFFFLHRLHCLFSVRPASGFFAQKDRASLPGHFSVFNIFNPAASAFMLHCIVAFPKRLDLFVCLQLRPGFGVFAVVGYGFLGQIV